MSDEIHIETRLTRLERDAEKASDEIRQLIISTQRMADLLEAQARNTPKLDLLLSKVHDLELGLSNAQLVQKGVVWLAGIVGSSAVAMAMAYIFGATK